MNFRMTFLAVISVTLLFLPISPPTQAFGCNSDSLRVLARLYPFESSYKYLMYDQAECFRYNQVTVLDSILNRYASRIYQSYLYDRLDSLLTNPDNNSITIADLYYFKACMQLEHILDTPYPDTAKAFEFFDSTLAYNKNYHLAWYNKGILYLVMKELDSAVECFLKAIEIENKHIHYWLHYGISLYHNGAEILSKKALDSAVQRSGRSFKSFKFLGDELKTFGLFPEALGLYDSALVIRRDDPDVWFSYANSNYLLDSTHEIRNYLDSTLKYFDYYKVSPEFLSLTYRLGLYKYSLRYLDKSLSVNSENIMSWLHKSRTHFVLGDTSIALGCLDSAIKYTPAGIIEDNNYFKGWQLVELGLFDRALSNLERVDLDNLDSISVREFYRYSAICYSQLGKYEEAVASCDSLLPLAPGDSGIVFFCDSIQAKLDEQ